MARSIPKSYPARSDDRTTPFVGTSERPVLFTLVRSLRPSQWTKNLLVFAGLVFAGADQSQSVRFNGMTGSRAILVALAAFAVFCALSSVVYLVNDVMDRES